MDSEAEIPGSGILPCSINTDVQAAAAESSVTVPHGPNAPSAVPAISHTVLPVPRLSPQEAKRRLLHALPGIFPYFFYFCPQTDPLEAWSLWVVTAACAAGTICALILKRDFHRRGEHGWAVSVVGYMSIIPALLWLFPGKSEIACGVVSIIAFGDSAATLAGLLFGRQRLPWNAAKSWAGSLAFVVGSLPFAVFSFWLQARPAIPLTIAFACVAPAVALAAIAESLPLRLNDNVRIGLVASATIVAIHGAMIGR